MPLGGSSVRSQKVLFFKKSNQNVTVKAAERNTTGTPSRVASYYSFLLNPTCSNTPFSESAKTSKRFAVFNLTHQKKKKKPHKLRVGVRSHLKKKTHKKSPGFSFVETLQAYSVAFFKRDPRGAPDFQAKLLALVSSEGQQQVKVRGGDCKSSRRSFK